MTTRDLLAYFVLAAALVAFFGGVLHLSDGNGVGGAAMAIGLGLVFGAYRMMTPRRTRTE